MRRFAGDIGVRLGDVAGAEDALSDAFVAAWERWPADGIPTKTGSVAAACRAQPYDDADRRNQVRQNSQKFLGIRQSNINHGLLRHQRNAPESRRYAFPGPFCRLNTRKILGHLVQFRIMVSPSMGL